MWTIQDRGESGVISTRLSKPVYCSSYKEKSGMVDTSQRVEWCDKYKTE